MKTVKMRGRARLLLGAVIFLSPVAAMTTSHAQTRLCHNASSQTC